MPTVTKRLSLPIFGALPILVGYQFHQYLPLNVGDIGGPQSLRSNQREALSFPSSFLSLPLFEIAFWGGGS